MGSFYKLLRGSPEHLAASISFPTWAEGVEMAYHEVNGLIGAPAQGPPEQLGQSLAQALDRAAVTVSRALSSRIPTSPPSMYCGTGAFMAFEGCCVRHYAGLQR